MKLLPDPGDRESLVSLLLLGEILTRRGEVGPLRRIWSPRGRRPAAKPQAPKGAAERGRPGKTE